MTQEQYIMIIKCIERGASAFADELIASLNGMITKCKQYERAEKKAKEATKEDKDNK